MYSTVFKEVLQKIAKDWLGLSCNEGDSFKVLKFFFSFILQLCKFESRMMLAKGVCLWTLYLVSTILIQGEASPVPKNKSHAAKGIAKLIYIVTH